MKKKKKLDPQVIHMPVQVWKHCSKSHLLDCKTSVSFPTLTRKTLPFFSQNPQMWHCFTCFAHPTSSSLPLACLQQPWVRELLHCPRVRRGPALLQVWIVWLLLCPEEHCQWPRSRSASVEHGSLFLGLLSWSGRKNKADTSLFPKLSSSLLLLPRHLCIKTLLSPPSNKKGKDTRCPHA